MHLHLSLTLFLRQHCAEGHDGGPAKAARVHFVPARVCLQPRHVLLD